MSNPFASAIPKPDPNTVWLKGHIIEGYDPNVWRRDDYGNAIRRTDYGNRQSDWGWEIDHILAVTLGGADHISNLRPLHYRANAALGGVLSGR